jgi:hypothetical protein
MRCANFQVVRLIAVTNGNGQRADSEIDMHLAVIDNTELQTTLTG